jgi:hypothetical protein
MFVLGLKRFALRCAASKAMTSGEIGDNPRSARALVSRRRTAQNIPAAISGSWGHRAGRRQRIKFNFNGCRRIRTYLAGGE